MWVTIMWATIMGVTIMDLYQTKLSAGTTMATAICIAMPRNADRLYLMQLLSPAFPVGAYAYSQGLEQAITERAVHDPASLTLWITGVLTHGAARMDAILLAHGRRRADLTDLAYAYAASAERALEMRAQGAAFGQVVASITGENQPALPYALALAPCHARP